MEAWTQILMASNVQSTALTPYAHVHQLEKHGYGADGSKIKKVRLLISLCNVAGKRISVNC